MSGGNSESRNHGQDAHAAHGRDARAPDGRNPCAASGRIRRWLGLARPEDYSPLTGPRAGWLFEDRPLARRWIILALGGLLVFYALLWSRWWYPLSDSALYVSLARNLNAGRGYTFLGGYHREAPPLYAVLLGGMMRISRSFAWLHVGSVVLLWLSSVLTYVGLRRWAPARLALLATLLTAGTYWYFQNAAVLMTEPLFLCCVWVGLIGLGRALDAGRLRPAWLALGLSGFALSTVTRVAGLLLAPALVIGLWWGQRRQAGPGARLAACAAMLLVAVGTAAGYAAWRRWTPAPPPAVLAGDGPERAARPFSTPSSEYRWVVERPVHAEPSTHSWISAALEAVRRRLYRFVGAPAQWMAESLVAASRAVFASRGKSVRYAGYLAASLALVMVVVGAARLVAHGRHWLAWPLTYMLPVLVIWADRFKPRYVNPVLPFLIICGLTGLWTAGQWLGRILPSRRVRAAAGRWAVPMAAGLILLGNLPPYLGEVYVRHVAAGSFHDVARRGAYADVVDAAAWIRANRPADQWVLTTDAPSYRVIHLMTGRPVSAVAGAVAGPDDKAGLAALRAGLGEEGVILVRYAGRPWPDWHFGRGDAEGPYWGLYVWKPGGPLQRVELSDGSKSLVNVPDSSI